MKKIIALGFFALSLNTAQAEILKDVSATIEYTHSDIEFDIGLESRFNGAAIGFSSDPKLPYGYWGKFEYSENSKSNSNYYEGTVGGHYNFLKKGDFYLNGLAGLGFARIESGITDSNLNFITLPVGIEGGYSITKNIDLFANAGYKWMFDQTGGSGYFGNGSTSTGSSNNNPDRYPDKVLCNDRSWHEGTLPSVCANFGGVVTNERDKTLCKDGWWSTSTGSGTCSGHGGILEDAIKNGSLVGMKANYGNSISFGDAESVMYKIGLRFRF